MTQHDNTIYLPGYLPDIVYGDNQGHPYITQHNALLSIRGKEISFYNDTEDSAYTAPSTLVAVWHIKERKQLA